MSVIANLDTDQGSVTIRVSGDFSLSDLDDFRKACQPETKQVTRFYFDFGQVSFLDPSALGMLMLFGDEMKEVVRSYIINCTPDIARMMSLFDLNEVFTINSLPKCDQVH